MEKKKFLGKKKDLEQKKSSSKKINKEQLIIIIVAAVLVVGIILSLVFLVIVPAYKKDKNFDYLTSDLSKYITLSEEDYKSISLNLAMAKPTITVNISPILLLEPAI